MTAARWTWKSSFSKECVKTQLPNKLALKMDGASAYLLTSLLPSNIEGIVLLRRVGGPLYCSEAFCVGKSGAVYCADLGTSSNYSNELLPFLRGVGKALKAVVGKDSLSLAHRQGLVGPKTLGRPFNTVEREAI